MDRDRCDGCGTRRSDWLTEDGRELREPAYVVTVDDCPGCRRLEQERDAEENKPRWRRVRLRLATIADWL